MQKEWEAALRSNRLQIPQCAGCKSWNWYPMPVCRSCGGADFVWKALRLEGTIHSWTRVHRNFSDHPIEPIPYVVGLVAPSDASGLRIACRYEGPDHQDVCLAIGDRVSLVIVSSSSTPYITFRR